MMLFDLGLGYFEYLDLPTYPASIQEVEDGMTDPKNHHRSCENRKCIGREMKIKSSHHRSASGVTTYSPTATQPSWLPATKRILSISRLYPIPREQGHDDDVIGLWYWHSQIRKCAWCPRILRGTAQLKAARLSYPRSLSDYGSKNFITRLDCYEMGNNRWWRVRQYPIHGFRQTRTVSGSTRHDNWPVSGATLMGS